MKELTKVLLRIIALYFFIQMIVHINHLIYQLGDSQINLRLLDWMYTIISLLLYVAIALGLWIYNDFIAGLIVSNKASLDVQMKVSYKELLNIVLKVFGLILILGSMESAMREIVRIFTIDLEGLDILTRSYFFIALLNPLIKILVGALLIFRKEK